MRLLTIIILLGLSACSQKCPDRLRGTWSSNNELTFAFADKQAKLSPKFRDAFEQVFGHMKVTYTDDEVIVAYPEREIKNIETGEITKLDGTTERYPLEIIGESKYIVALRGWQNYDKYGFSEDNYDYIITLHFLKSKEAYWVYCADTLLPEGNMHMREYFVKEGKSNN